MRSNTHLLLLAFFIITLLSIASAGMRQNIKLQTEVEIGKSLSTVLEMSRQALETCIEEHKGDALLWGNTPEIRQDSQELLTAHQTQKALINSPAQARLRNWYHPIAAKKGYLNYFIITADNINLATSHDEDIGTQSLLIKQPKFLQKIWSGEVAVSLPQSSDPPLANKNTHSTEKVATLFIGAPIRDASGRVIAIFILHHNLDNCITHVLQRGRIGTTGETYAFDIQGRMLSNSRFHEQLHSIGLIPYNKHEILNVELRDPTVDLTQGEKNHLPSQQLSLTYMAKHATAGESGVSTEPYRDYRGVMVVGAWQWLHELGFGIATELDANEAYQILHTTQFFISALALLTTLLLLALAALIMINRKRRQAKEALRKANTRLEERIAERTADLRKTNKTLQREIVERQQTENELRKLTSAVLQSPASIFITSIEGTIEYVNPKFTAVTGYSHEEVVGQNPNILNSGYQTKEFYQNLWSTITSGKEWNGTFLNKKKSGELFWERASISPILNKKGEITNFVAVKEDITQHKQAEEQIHNLLQQNRSLTQKLFDTQEEERRHLARELHDEFGQWLTAIQLHSQVISELEHNKTSTIYNSAKTIHKSAKQMHEAARNIIHKLRPQALDNLGLRDGLHELVHQWQSHHTSTICHLDIQCNLDKLNGPAKITLYRIVQESLTNAAKHSQAHHLAINLLYEKARNAMPGCLLLCIKDDGKGMDLSAPSSGIGLTGMRERTLAAGGEFHINSQPGKGVTIEVRLPLNLEE